ncbi:MULTISPECIES: MFS transporter [unclassified Micromonospora]|uniref:MFS transporter n=1 Tax=unclassified Micromonospora TaxID=2617518 RepID=UPI00362A8D07
MPPALLALAVSAFGIGTTEFVIMGLLPEVAGDFHVSIPTAGLLISGYALGVVVGAPVLTVGAARLRRKHALVGLMAIFVIGNALSALAPTYGLLMTGRIVASLCHGAFFGLGSVAAASLVPSALRARAIALMFGGLTLANVLGVPMGTALGQRFGWRATFWAVVLLGVVGLVALLLLVPDRQPEGDTGVRAQLAPFRRPQVWLALAMTALGFGGLFASFTYVAPMMTEVAGFAPSSVTWLLVLFGIGLCLGNYLGGRAADRALMPTLFVVLALLTAVLAVFTVTSHHRLPAAVTLFLLGTAGFATVPGLQMRAIQQAGRDSTLTSALNIAAFNLGNAIGAYLGGAAIDAGYGLTAPNLVGAGLTAASIAVAAVAVLLARRTPVPAAGAGTGKARPLTLPAQR